MPASTTPYKSTHAPLVTEALGDLVGGTPLIQLRRSGDGNVWLKHEGIQPGGSYFDRVAKVQMDRLGSSAAGVLLEGATSFTVSALTLANARGLRAVVLLAADAPQRLLGLIRRMCPDVRRYRNAEERSRLIGDLESEELVFLDRHDAGAHLQAMTDIAVEGREASDRPLPSWVLVDYGVPVDELKAAMRRVLGHPIRLVFIDDDAELERTLDGAAASRRAQVGHREGLLVGPVAAEVIDRAVDVALASGERVCAIIPDGGQRYLGWW